MTNEDKGREFDRLLQEFDMKAREVSLIKSKFDLSKEDNEKIKKLEKEMDLIQRKAHGLGSL